MEEKHKDPPLSTYHLTCFHFDAGARFILEKVENPSPDELLLLLG